MRRRSLSGPRAPSLPISLARFAHRTTHRTFRRSTVGPHRSAHLAHASGERSLSADRSSSGGASVERSGRGALRRVWRRTVGSVRYDDIVVGAGSCGAVLAARLTENLDRRVLLLEAGPDYGSRSETPADLLYGWMSLVDHDWGWTALAVGERSVPYPRGKVVGGSSAVNGTIALRGDPADFDEWASRGLAEWSWDEVLPFLPRTRG